MTDDSQSGKRRRVEEASTADIDQLSQSLRSLLLTFGTLVEEAKSRRVSSLWNVVSEQNTRQERKTAIQRSAVLMPLVGELLLLMDMDSWGNALKRLDIHTNLGLGVRFVRRLLADQEERVPGTLQRFLDHWGPALVTETVARLNKHDTVEWLYRNTQGALKTEFAGKPSHSLQQLIKTRLDTDEKRVNFVKTFIPMLKRRRADEHKRRVDASARKPAAVKAAKEEQRRQERERFRRLLVDVQSALPLGTSFTAKAGATRIRVRVSQWNGDSVVLQLLEAAGGRPVGHEVWLSPEYDDNGDVKTGRWISLSFGGVAILMTAAELIEAGAGGGGSSGSAGGSGSGSAGAAGSGAR